MKKLRSLYLVCAGLLLTVQSCSSPKASQKIAQAEERTNQSKEVVVDSDHKKLSRSFGHLLARQLSKSEEMHFDLSEIAAGILNEIEGKPAPLSQSEYEAAMAGLQQVAFEKKSNENLQIAEKFLKENALADGVVQVKENLLQYKVIEKGTGEELKGTPSALLHYVGTFADGKVFSSSREGKDPILLPLTQTIQGFALGMQGMREGEKRILYIHPKLAYGTSGALPPNSLLIFEIELIKIQEEAAVVATSNEEKASS